MKFNKSAFIGYGKMAKILADIASGRMCESDHIIVSSPSLWSGKTQTIYRIAASNALAAKDADVVILGTKPPLIEDVCKEIAPVIRPDTLIVSIASGITIPTMLDKLGNKTQPIIRAMPNTPLCVGAGMTGLYKNQFVTPTQEEIILDLFNGAGDAIMFNQEDTHMSEDVLNQVTAISGSGPAYFFYIQEQMIESAIQLGLSRAHAEQLVKKTMLGAAKLTNESAYSLAQQRAQVTSPNGTTAAAIHAFEQSKLNVVLDAGIQAAYRRAQELGQPKESNGGR